MTQPRKKPVTVKRKKKRTKSKAALSLTILQKRTCDIFHSMKKPKKGKAYELAGSTCRGKTARVEAERMMKLPHVRAYLESLKQEATDRALKKADDIIAELEKVAFSNIGDFLSFDDKGVKLNSSSKLTRAQLVTIEEVNDYFTKQGTRRLRLKLHSKLHALELLGKRCGLFPNKQEITGGDGGPLEVNFNITKTYKKKK